MEVISGHFRSAPAPFLLSPNGRDGALRRPLRRSIEQLPHGRARCPSGPGPPLRAVPTKGRDGPLGRPSVGRASPRALPPPLHSPNSITLKHHNSPCPLSHPRLSVSHPRLKSPSPFGLSAINHKRSTSLYDISYDTIIHHLSTINPLDRFFVRQFSEKPPKHWKNPALPPQKKVGRIALF